MPAAKPPLVLMAHVTAAHGIRGDVTLRSYAEDPHDLAEYKALVDETGGRRFEITALRVTAKGVVAHFKGIDDRTAAEGLRGLALHVPRSALPAAEAGAYYNVDLVGLAAFSPDGARIGTVIAVENFGGGPLLELRRAGVRETDYVPFTDAFVPVVDVAAGRVIVVMPVMVGDPEPASASGDDGQ